MLLWHCMAAQATQISMAMLVAQLLDTHMATGGSPDIGHPHGTLVPWEATQPLAVVEPWTQIWPLAVALAHFPPWPWLAGKPPTSACW